MKCLFYASIIGLLVSCSITEGKSSDEECVKYELLESNGTEFLLNGELYSGCVERRNEKGEVNLKFTLVDGVMEGNFTDFIDNKIARKGSYSNNIISGEVTTYYASGEVMIKEFFDSLGALSGRCTEFYKSGKPKYIYHFQDGVRRGPFYVYFENGMLSDSGSYMNNQIDGLALGYFENGSERSWDSLREGLHQGLSINFLDKNKNTYMWGEMKDGNSVGRWYYRLEDDSCFVRTYIGDDYVDRICLCDDLKLPPYQEW